NLTGRATMSLAVNPNTPSPLSDVPLSPLALLGDPGRLARFLWSHPPFVLPRRAKKHHPRPRTVEAPCRDFLEGIPGNLNDQGSSPPTSHRNRRRPSPHPSRRQRGSPRNPPGGDRGP